MGSMSGALHTNSSFFEPNHVVSIAKARRILGSTAKSMSDNQIKELIHFLHLLAKEQLIYNGSKDYVSRSTPTNKS